MSLARRLATWRRLGARRGAQVALSLISAPVRDRARAARLRRRPPRVGRDELVAALGAPDLAAVLRGRMLAAMPTVAAFERELDELDGPGRARLLERAEAIAAHRFDLLGSGPTDLGAEIDWHLDFKTGRRWPPDHISRLVISYPDGSDIKVPWELSRCQHLPILAAAHRLTGEPRWVEEIAAQLSSWLARNPVEFGPNWGCAMDVAIRAANWIATLVMLAGREGPSPGPAPLPGCTEEVLESLLLHGRFIRSHLEWAPVRGNHYLSDLVGLLTVAVLFGEGPEGREWGRFAAGELAGELAHQIRPDGCDHEASIPYHRLVCELFICGAQAAREIDPAAAEQVSRRIDAMLEFTRDYTRPDGLAPQIGDADDGRYLPLDDYGRADPRSHLHLFAQAGAGYHPTMRHAAYPDGGYWIMRSGDLFLIIRCGDVGVGGLGSHAHNDALSFELAVGTQPVIVDPGSFLYTADPAERNRFRSTAFHSTLRVDEAEQNPLSERELFTMSDRRRAQATRWDLSNPAHPIFEGLHHGFEHLAEPAVHQRRLELLDPGRLRITDTVRSGGEHRLDWTLPFVPCRLTAEGSRARAVFESGMRVTVEAAGVELRVEPGWLSPSYGRRVPTSFLRAAKLSAPGEDHTEITVSVRP